MKRRLRMLGLAIIAFLPNFLKQPIYRWCFGYRIGRDVRIGVVFLDCQQLTIGDSVRLAHGIAFLRCGKVEIGDRAIIGSLNLFRGGTSIELGEYASVMRLNIINAIPDHDCIHDPDSSFSLGYGAVVTSEHRIDFTDRVQIGRCSILGGRNSSIWTHLRQTGKPVVVGDYCYLGSEIRIAPGGGIPDCCVVGIGAVVTRAAFEPYSLIAGVPARWQRSLKEEDYPLIFEKTRRDLPDQTYPTPPVKSTVVSATEPAVETETS